MKQGFFQLGFLFALALGWGRSAVPDPDDLVRQGNAAFAQGDFAAATDWYRSAEERTNDPGLVAFNEAATLYQLGQFREADIHYRRCREDAVGPRRARLLFNLGNCLVQESQGRNPARLREAIQFYQQCLEASEIDASLKDDARHNLELARLLWTKAKAGREGADDSNPEENLEDSRSTGDRNDQELLRPELAERDPSGRPGASPDAAGDAKSAAARPDQAPPPGKGNLPPVPDQDDLVPLSPEEAAAHLRQAATRILHDREEYRHRPVPAPLPNVLDW